MSATPKSNSIGLVFVPGCIAGRSVLALLAMVCACPIALAQQLPPGGTTTWEMQELEVIVTFLLFDPKDPAIALPKGLRFATAREVAAQAPEFQEHLKQYPAHADWAFSIVEFVRPKSWVLDGKALTLPENGGIGVWFAPVDHSQLAAELPKESFETVIAPSPGGMLVLGLWVPDQEYAAYMRARGHRAESGMVTMVKNSSGALQGEMQVGELNVKASATPQGEATSEPDPFTQVFYEPGQRVENVVVLAGGNVRERQCTAEWSKKGDHPLARGVFVGPTILNVEGPLKGSAYRLQEARKP